MLLTQSSCRWWELRDSTWTFSTLCCLSVSWLYSKLHRSSSVRQLFIVSNCFQHRTAVFFLDDSRRTCLVAISVFSECMSCEVPFLFYYFCFDVRGTASLTMLLCWSGGQPASLCYSAGQGGQPASLCYFTSQGDNQRHYLTLLVKGDNQPHYVTLLVKGITSLTMLLCWSRGQPASLCYSAG